MNKIEFHKLADQEINYLFARLEQLDMTMALELDILDEILTINLPNKDQYVINKQSYAQQIWLSSPVSGAYHFDHDANNKTWTDKQARNLRDILSFELREFIGDKPLD